MENSQGDHRIASRLLEALSIYMQDARVVAFVHGQLTGQQMGDLCLRHERAPPPCDGTTAIPLSRSAPTIFDANTSTFHDNAFISPMLAQGA